MNGDNVKNRVDHESGSPVIVCEKQLHAEIRLYHVARTFSA